MQPWITGAGKGLFNHKTKAMTKQIFILLLSLFSTCGGPLRSQSVADLLAQLSLDTEKLTSLKATLQDMYKGYEGVRQGYTRVRDLARDNFNLHELFIDGLWVLSPNVRGDPRIAAILNTEYRFVSDYKKATARLNTSLFTSQELDYIIDMYSALLQQTKQSMEELTMVITDNQLQMSDAQRLQAISRIDTATRSQMGLLQQLNNMLAVQSAQRQAASNDINTLKLLYGIPH
jgi:hypothetical protein